MVCLRAGSARTGHGFFEKTSALTTSRWAAWLIIGFGVVARVGQYIANRSLWHDEAPLALSIVDRSFAGLLQPLDYDRAAPIGFLLVERLGVLAFGNNEYALRLLPLLAGIASLVLFCRLATAYLAEEALLLAVGLFAIVHPLIYYASEAKQYSTDVAIALLILLVAIDLLMKSASMRRVFLLGLLGGVVVWFSHPSVFVLGGVGATLAVSRLIRRDWKGLGGLSIAYLLWMGSIAGSYIISWRFVLNSQRLLNFWGNSYMPLPPRSFRDLRWFVDTLFDVFHDPVGLSPYASGLAALLFAAGCIWVYSAQWERASFLLLPVVLTLLASGFHKYPFRGRLLLFVVPSLIVLIAAGVEWVKKRMGGSALVTFALIAVLCAEPLLFAGYHLIRPREREELRPVLGYVSRHWQDGDRIYVYYGSGPAFRYYATQFNLSDKSYMFGVKPGVDWNKFVDELDDLRGRERVWFLFSVAAYGADEARFALYHLDRIGTQIDSLKMGGAATYLYDLHEGGNLTKASDMRHSWVEIALPLLSLRAEDGEHFAPPG